MINKVRHAVMSYNDSHYLLTDVKKFYDKKSKKAHVLWLWEYIKNKDIAKNLIETLNIDLSKLG